VATWATADGGHSYAYWGPNGVHWGRCDSSGHYTHHKASIDPPGNYYGCKGWYSYHPHNENYRYGDGTSGKAGW